MSGPHTFVGSGGTTHGVVTATARVGPGPALVLLPAVSGLNDYVLRRSRTLAAAGYTTLALDYYDGQARPPMRDMAEILAAVAALDDTAVAESARAAAGHLADRPDVDGERIGIVGFCVGGALAMLAAAGEATVFRGVVSYYGQIRYGELTSTKPRDPLDVAAELTCPLLGHYGDEDHLIPQADVEELRRRTAGRPAEVYSYPGAGHAFDEDFRPVYRPVGATIAWTRTSAFLGWCLS